MSQLNQSQMLIFLEFFAQVLPNKTLREAMMVALEQQDNTNLVQLATEQGYTFTAEELNEGFQTITTGILNTAISDAEIAVIQKRN
ncbi:Nif11-like leader peptide family natural product precursor [Phormidium nigroviride]